MNDNLKSLVENALGERLPEDAAWDNPQFLQGKFSREALAKGLADLSKTRRLLGAAENASLYSVGDYDQARELLATARDLHPRFRAVSAEDAAAQKAGRVVAHGSGTPQSFHAELQGERRERERDDGDRGV